MPERPRRLVRHIHLARFQPLDQFVGRQVDDLDLGIVEHGIGHGFAHPHPREACHDVVETFDVLDVERGQYVDAGVAQLLDILPALRVAAAGGIGVREFVDQRDGRLAHQHGVDVEFIEPVRAVDDGAAWQDFERSDQRFGFGATVRFDHADDDIGPALEQFGPFAQHLESLADPGRRAKKDFQPPARFLLRRLEQRLRGRSGGIVHPCGVVEIRSSCRLRRRTLTCGSPITPSSG